MSEVEIGISGVTEVGGAGAGDRPHLRLDHRIGGQEQGDFHPVVAGNSDPLGYMRTRREPNRFPSCSAPPTVNGMETAGINGLASESPTKSITYRSATAYCSHMSY